MRGRDGVSEKRRERGGRDKGKENNEQLLWEREFIAVGGV